MNKLWEEEIPDMYCVNQTTYTGVSNQIECQRKCETIGVCLGISYSYKIGFTHFCLVCMTDVLTTDIDYMGFYRKPGKSKW